MAEYQIIRDAHCIKLGLGEDGGDPNRMSLDDLDALKQKMGVD